MGIKHNPAITGTDNPAKQISKNNYNNDHVVDGDVDFGGFKLTNVANPTSDQHAATKNYVDNLANGLKFKDACVVATTANITLSGTQTIDGVGVIAGDRVLVKDQTDQKENGIYIVAAGAWSRSADFDSGSEVVAATVVIDKGTSQKETQWTLTTDAPIVIGTTNLAFAKSNGNQVTAVNIGTAGVGVFKQKTGNQLEMKKINSTTGVTITDDTAENEVDVGLAQDIGSHDMDTLIDGHPTTSIAIASGVLAATRRAIIVQAESGTADVLDTISGLNDGDYAELYADAGDTITVTHDIGGTNSLHLTDKINILLSEKVPLVLVRKGGEFYQESGPQITEIVLAINGAQDNLATGDNKQAFPVPKKGKVIKIKGNVDTGSSSGVVTLAVRKNSTDILSTLITIDQSETSSETAATPPVIKSDGSEVLAADDRLRLDVDGVGVGSKGGVVTLWVENLSDE